MSDVRICDGCGEERPPGVSVERDRWWTLEAPHAGRQHACQPKCVTKIVHAEDRAFLRLVKETEASG